jgi:hypothetical protein
MTGRVKGAWGFELRNFKSKRQQGLFFFRAHPPPPSAGFGVPFEEMEALPAEEAPP